MKSTTTTKNASPATQGQFYTHLGFSEYFGEQHLYDGNAYEKARGSREEVVSYLRSLLSLIPADEESLRWEGANGAWYSGSEAAAAIKAEILQPLSDEEDAGKNTRLTAFRVTYTDATNYVTSMAAGVSLSEATAYLSGAHIFEEIESGVETRRTVAKVEQL